MGYSADLTVIIDNISTAIADLNIVIAALNAGDVASLNYIRNAASTPGQTALSLADNLNTSLTRLSSTRAGYLDNLSGGAVALASVLTSARGGYIDNLSAGAVALNSDMATVLSRLSATRAGYLDNLSGGAVATVAGVWANAARTLTTLAGLQVKSVQTGVVTIPNAATSQTATITSVDVTKVVLSLLGNVGDTALTDTISRIELSNATTLTAKRNGNSGGCDVGYCLTEFF